MNSTYRIRPTEAKRKSRRIFLSRAFSAAGTLALFNSPVFNLFLLRAMGKSSLASSTPIKRQGKSVQQVIDLILHEINAGAIAGTVDTIKFGDPNQLVTGIVSTMFPTIGVIEQAAALKANFIIAHEPTFYNHADNLNWVPGNAIVVQKQALLKKYGIAVWRCHDYWHRYNPDGILHGLLQSAGWLPYLQHGTRVVDLGPSNSLALTTIVSHLKTTLSIGNLRFIGNPSQVCQRIVILPGSVGGQAQVAAIEQNKPDLLIVGEASEWETPEYVRDLQSTGGKTALVLLGHAVSEEPGMKWMAEWLSPKVPEIKVHHIASGDPFTWGS